MKFKTLPIGKIKPYENNPRKNDGAVDAVAESIRQCGYCAPIVVDEAGVILAGHTRYKALQKLGWATVKVCVAEGMSEEQKRKYRVLDNKTGELAEWDNDLLALELDGLDFDGFDFGLLDMELPDAGAEDDEPSEAVEDDFEPELPAETAAKRGQVWQLGAHRLMCGDATSSADVQTLMGGARADMVFTDPPYGVAIGDKNKALNEVQKAGRILENIEGDTLDEAALYEMLKAAFINVREACAEDAVYYVTSPQGGSLSLMMMMMMRDAGLKVRHILIWRKNCATFSVGRLDYDYQHEPIFYTWTAKHHNFRGGKFRTTVWDVDKPRKCDLHPTMKPVELVGNAILDGTQAGMIVLDTFGGSGTTLIAAEQLGRRAYLMEIDPKYCDVIIARWEALTGQKAVLADV